MFTGGAITIETDETAVRFVSPDPDRPLDPVLQLLTAGLMPVLRFTWSDGSRVHFSQQ